MDCVAAATDWIRCGGLPRAQVTFYEVHPWTSPYGPAEAVPIRSRRIGLARPRESNQRGRSSASMRPRHSYIPVRQRPLCATCRKHECREAHGGARVAFSPFQGRSRNSRGKEPPRSDMPSLSPEMTAMLGYVHGVGPFVQVKRSGFQFRGCRRALESTEGIARRGEPWTASVCSRDRDVPSANPFSGRSAQGTRRAASSGRFFGYFLVATRKYLALRCENRFPLYRRGSDTNYQERRLGTNAPPTKIQPPTRSPTPDAWPE